MTTLAISGFKNTRSSKTFAVTARLTDPIFDNRYQKFFVYNPLQNAFDRCCRGISVAKSDAPHAFIRRQRGLQKTHRFCIAYRSGTRCRRVWFFVPLGAERTVSLWIANTDAGKSRDD